MKRIVLYGVLLLSLAWTGSPLRADAHGSDDTVTLKDGRVLKGQVVEESRSSVVLSLGGVQRSFDRDFIAKISYGKGPDAAAPALDGGVSEGRAQASAQAGPGAEGYPDGPSDGGALAVPQGPRPDLVAVLSRRYQVPPGDVLWVRRQGVPDPDLPLVFWVAAAAQVTPRAVVKLYLQGWSWSEIEGHFHLQEPGGGYDAGNAAPAPDDGAVYDPGYNYDYDAGLDGWYAGDGWGFGWDVYGPAYGGGWYGGGGGGRGHGGGAWRGGSHGGGWGGHAGAGGRSYAGGSHVGASVSGGSHGSSARGSGGDVSGGGRGH